MHCYAAVDPSAIVEPGAVVFPGARIAAGCRVGACSVVGPGVVLGEGTQVGYGCSLSHATVGARCTLHHGVRLGADGFGFAVDPTTGELTKKPQERSVVLGDGVELGANTCVDRGSWRDTRIGDNTKVDNLVQIGHNVVIGALRAACCVRRCTCLSSVRHRQPLPALRTRCARRFDHPRRRCGHGRQIRDERPRFGGVERPPCCKIGRHVQHLRPGRLCRLPCDSCCVVAEATGSAAARYEGRR